MKVVVAIDSFKGSLTSMEAGEAVREGIQAAHPTAEVIVSPLADGGEGTVKALVQGLKGREETVEITGARGQRVAAIYGYLEETQTAIMEMAEAAGITQIPKEERNPLETTTYGLGEMILNALEKGCRKFLIGIGGSATNDGGMGMLEALGAVFLDAEGKPLGPYGKDMLRIASMDLSKLDPRIKESQWQIACDVENPLCGPNGASAVFGPQKGATPEMVKQLDAGLRQMATVAERLTGKHTMDLPGAGAAGGLGYAFVTFLEGKLESGISLVVKLTGLEDRMKDAQVVVTGEGRLDFQTAMGKAPIGVAKMGKRHNALVVAFAGSVTPDAGECNEQGIDAFFPIVRGISTLEEAMDPARAKANMTAAVEQVFRLLPDE